MYQSATGYHFCAHWYLMMVANCLPEIPAYIASKASANFSESSADADDPCTIIHFYVYSKARKWKLPPLITHFYIDSDLTPDFGAPKSFFLLLYSWFAGRWGQTSAEQQSENRLRCSKIRRQILTVQARKFAGSSVPVGPQVHPTKASGEWRRCGRSIRWSRPCRRCRWWPQPPLDRRSRTPRHSNSNPRHPIKGGKEIGRMRRPNRWTDMKLAIAMLPTTDGWFTLQGGACGPTPGLGWHWI